VEKKKRQSLRGPLHPEKEKKRADENYKGLTVFLKGDKGIRAGRRSLVYFEEDTSDWSNKMGGIAVKRGSLVHWKRTPAGVCAVRWGAVKKEKKL